MTEEKKGTQIALVDDDGFLLDMYATKFKKENFEVVACSSADDCLSKLRGGLKPDVVLFDLIMPKIDGIEMLKIIKEEELAKDSVKIVLSNQGQQSDIEKVEKIGIDGYIVKALNTPSQVVEKVNEIIKRKK